MVTQLAHARFPVGSMVNNNGKYTARFPQNGTDTDGLRRRVK